MSGTDDPTDNKNGVDHLPSLCPSVVDRYFARGYKVNLPKGGSLSDLRNCKSNMNDVRILRHSNKICVVTLAPKHPALQPGSKISSVSFKVTDRLDRSKNVVSGKRKRGAQWLNPTAPLCILTCADESRYTVYCGIRGKLVEMNDQLLSHPDLLHSKTETEGYIAIVMPKLEEANGTMDGLFTEEEYDTYVKAQIALNTDQSEVSK